MALPLLEYEHHPEKSTSTTNFDSAVRVSISGSTIAPPAAAQAVAPAATLAASAIPLSHYNSKETGPIELSRRVLTSPEHFTAQLPDSSEEFDEY